MSLTSYAAGATCYAGFKTHTNDWNTTNTGVQLGAGDGLELLPNGVPRTATVMAENTALIGGGPGVQRYPTKATESIEGAATFNWNYSGPQRLIASLFGVEVASSLGSGGYSHLFTLGNNSSIVGNFAWTDNLRCHDLNMAKVEAITFALPADGQRGTITPTFLAKRELVDGSGANTTSTMASVTLPTQASTRYAVLTSSQLIVRYNAASGDALAAGDKIYPSGMTLTFARAYKRRRTARNAPYVDEPVVGAWLPVSGSLTFPIDEVSGWWSDMVDGTEKKMDIALTGSLIGGSVYWKYLFELPSVNVSTEGLPDLNTPDLLETTINFTAHYAASQPTGMAFNFPRLTVTDTTATTHATNGA